MSVARPRAKFRSLRVTPEFRDFVLDQLAGVRELRAKRMFGGLGLYSGERFFGIVAADEVFFKVDDPARFSAWYREHLGIDAARPADNFVWRERDAPDNVGYTVWSPFPRDTGYFGSSEQPLMINYRVRDLDALLAKLRAAGVEQVKDVEEYPYGRFAWILDGEGNRVELWEPAQQTAE